MAGSEELLDINEASVLMGVKVRTLREWTASRRVPHFKVGHLIRFSRSELEAWLEAGRRGPRLETGAAS